MKRIVRSLLLVAVVACSAPAREPDTVRFNIPSGTPLGVVASGLAEQGIIGSAPFFKFYAKITGRQREIQAGLYDLPRPSSSRTILRLLTSGAVATNALVVHEGLMISEIADMVQAIGISRDQFLAATRDSSAIASMGIVAPNLEGFLYPSTYNVPVGASAEDLVAQMLREFQRQWMPGWDARASAMGLSKREVVTLASIIEGEVMFGPDRPFVSSVYHNRLDRGMRLQADPTVIFGLGVRRRLYERDYQFRSPYNTYLIDGLPPGPIGQPSAASIEAALYPETSDFLFLVADTTGQHIFSRTLREHNRHVQRLRRIWASRR